MGWTVDLVDNDGYTFRKPMKNKTTFFNKYVKVENAEQITNELFEEYVNFDLDMEVSCWQDDQGLPSKDTGYKNVEELKDAFKGFKNDLFKLAIGISNLYINNYKIEK